MVDGVALERMGLPTAVVACDLLISTTGLATARLQGAPNLPFVVLPVGPGAPIQDLTPEELRARALEAAARVAAILTGEPQTALTDGIFTVESSFPRQGGVSSV